ncbi:hypothetical protein [Sphingobacterium sp. LRF_L2]|uniref:hypothetical protein n=1 Tax=Sphingobacterium sp. LRF_L2 TaxID=3369421 RepID=UPI003F607C72
MRIFFYSTLVLLLSACNVDENKGIIYYNGSRSYNISSDKIEIYLNGDILLDTVLSTYNVDTYTPIKEFKVRKHQNNTIHLKVNNIDSTILISNYDRDFKLFFFFDNKTKARNKMLDALSFWPRANPDRSQIMDSITKQYGDTLDSLHVHVKYD